MNSESEDIDAYFSEEEIDLLNKQQHEELIEKQRIYMRNSKKRLKEKDLDKYLEKQRIYKRNSRERLKNKDINAYRALEMKHQQAYFQRKNQQQHESTSSSFSPEELSEIDANYDFERYQRQEKDVFQEGCKKLSYDNFCYNCCSICERDIIKSCTTFNKLDDSLISVITVIIFIINI